MATTSALIPFPFVPDQQSLVALEGQLRGNLAAAEDTLRRAELLLRGAADLPPESRSPDCLRLLTEQRDLAQRRVRHYRQALTVVEGALLGRAAR